MKKLLFIVLCLFTITSFAQKYGEFRPKIKGKFSNDFEYETWYYYENNKTAVYVLNKSAMGIKRGMDVITTILKKNGITNIEADEDNSYFAKGVDKNDYADIHLSLLLDESEVDLIWRLDKSMLYLKLTHDAYFIFIYE